MFDRFTVTARQVVVDAQEAARSLMHSYIGTEHILLGLVQTPDLPLRMLLADHGVTWDAVSEQVRRIVGRGDGPVTGQLPFTPRSKKVLELALREALSHGSPCAQPEHIMLGLIREGEGVADRIVRDFGVDPEVLRQQILASMSSVQTPVAIELTSRQRRSLARWCEANRTLLAPLGYSKIGVVNNHVSHGSQLTSDQAQSFIDWVDLYGSVVRVGPLVPAYNALKQALAELSKPAN